VFADAGRAQHFAKLATAKLSQPPNHRHCMHLAPIENDLLGLDEPFIAQHLFHLVRRERNFDDI